MTDLSSPAPADLAVPVKRERLALRCLRRLSLVRMTAAAIVVAAVYWGAIASDRYVSEARIVVDRTDLTMTQVPDFSAMLGGAGGREEFLMRDHLLSVDMLNKLDASLKLREHYSDTQYDPLSRLWHFSYRQELFHRYFLSRINVVIDDQSGAMVINVEAFTPAMAQAVARMLVQEGESFMNELGHRLARDQVAFLERQIVPMEGRVNTTRQAVIAFQNKNGLASPQATAEGMNAIAGRLEGQLSDLRARRTTLLSYLSPDAADVVQVNNSIRALEAEMAQTRNRLASPSGGKLNSTIEEFQRLQTEAEFAQKLYHTALGALEKGRIETVRTLKKASVLQSPTLAQYPMQPKRIYNIAAFAVVALLILTVLRLAVAIIKDHKD